MADKTLPEIFTDIADAIRYQENSIDLIPVEQMAPKIMALEGSGGGGGEPVETNSEGYFGYSRYPLGVEVYDGEETKTGYQYYINSNGTITITGAQAGQNTNPGVVKDLTFNGKKLIDNGEILDTSDHPCTLRTVASNVLITQYTMNEYNSVDIPGTWKITEAGYLQFTFNCNGVLDTKGNQINYVYATFGLKINVQGVIVTTGYNGNNPFGSFWWSISPNVAKGYYGDVRNTTLIRPKGQGNLNGVGPVFIGESYLTSNMMQATKLECIRDWLYINAESGSNIEYNTISNTIPTPSFPLIPLFAMIGVAGGGGGAGRPGPRGPKGDKGDTGPAGPQGASVENVQFVKSQTTDTDNVYSIKTTLTDGELLDSGAMVVPHGGVGPQGPKGDTGENALSYNNIVSMGRVPVAGDEFNVATTLCTRTPVIGDVFLCIFRHRTRSWLTSCKISAKVNDTNYTASISFLQESTGAQGEQGLMGLCVLRTGQTLTTSSTSANVSRLSSKPSGRGFLTSDTLIDPNGLVFAITANTPLTASTIPISYRYTTKGPKGEQGPQGKTGPQGDPGVTASMSGTTLTLTW